LTLLVVFGVASIMSCSTASCGGMRYFVGTKRFLLCVLSMLSFFVVQDDCGLRVLLMLSLLVVVCVLCSRGSVCF
jgi:hypothetical protein